MTKQAFAILGENGIIRAADKHACKECTQPYKKTADIITGDDPAALVGVDENRAVPALVVEGANLPAEADEQARQNTSEAASAVNEEMNIDNPPACDSYTAMAVVDGIVISSSVCYLPLYYLSKLIAIIALCL